MRLLARYRDALAEAAPKALRDLLALHPNTSVAELRELIAGEPSLGNLTLSQLLGGRGGKPKTQTKAQAAPSTVGASKTKPVRQPKTPATTKPATTKAGSHPTSGCPRGAPSVAAPLRDHAEEAKGAMEHANGRRPSGARPSGARGPDRPRWPERLGRSSPSPPRGYPRPAPRHPEPPHRGRPRVLLGQGPGDTVQPGRIGSTRTAEEIAVSGGDTPTATASYWHVRVSSMRSDHHHDFWLELFGS